MVVNGRVCSPVPEKKGSTKKGGKGRGMGSNGSGVEAEEEAAGVARDPEVALAEEVRAGRLC